MKKKNLCGAKTRKGKPCQRKPVKGKRRCRLHGGATPNGKDSPHFVHGRYATSFRGELRKKYEAIQTDEQPLDLLPELYVQRTVLQQHIENISKKENPTMKEIHFVSILADDVVKTATAIIKSRNDAAYTAVEIRFLVAAMKKVIERNVTDPDQRRDFIDEVRALIPGRIEQPGAAD